MMSSANYVICSEDQYGYLHIAHPVFMTARDANMHADAKYPSCHVVSYPVYKSRRDPDKMSERELRRITKSPPLDKKSKAIVITGKLKDMTRKQAINAAEKLGFRVVSRVDANTVAIVIGDIKGLSTSKIDDATRYGTRKVTQGFLMI